MGYLVLGEYLADVGFLVDGRPIIFESTHQTSNILKLYAVCMAVFIWRDELHNKRFVLHCDNKGVVSNLNHTTSGCKHCMQLIRMLTVHSLKYNMRVFGVHVRGIHNGLSDSFESVNSSHVFVGWPKIETWNHLQISSTQICGPHQIFGLKDNFFLYL